MKKGFKMATAIMIGITLFLGGCLDMDKSTKLGKLPEEEKILEKRKEAYEKENFVRIQHYKGEGFTLRDSRKETGEIAEKHRDEVEKAVQKFFREKYKTEVVVHNIVSAIDGVCVFVESVGKPHFYTFAIVPVDIKNEKVETDRVWSLEGEVENAIQGGLYAMAFEEEFAKLDKYLESIDEEYPVVGKNIEMIANVRGTGYSTPYYFVSIFDDVFDKLFEIYLAKPNLSKQELKEFFNENPFDPKYLSIGIEFYMEDAGAEPDQNIFNKIVADLEQMEGIPKGSYVVILNDNFIDRSSAIGTKENTLERIYPNKIIKE